MIYHFFSKHNKMLSTHMLKLMQWKIIWIVQLYQFLYCFMDNWSNMSKQNAEFPRNIIYFDVTRKIGIKHSAKCIFLTCHLIVQTLPCNFSILFQPHALHNAACSTKNGKWFFKTLEPFATWQLLLLLYFYFIHSFIHPSRTNF